VFPTGFKSKKKFFIFDIDDEYLVYDVTGESPILLLKATLETSTVNVVNLIFDLIENETLKTGSEVYVYRYDDSFLHPALKKSLFNNLRIKITELGNREVFNNQNNVQCLCTLEKSRFLTIPFLDLSSEKSVLIVSPSSLTIYSGIYDEDQNYGFLAANELVVLKCLKMLNNFMNKRYLLNKKGSFAEVKISNFYKAKLDQKKISKVFSIPIIFSELNSDYYINRIYDIKKRGEHTT